MFWKIDRWFRNRRKKYLVFAYYRRKQVWNQEIREYEWSEVEPHYRQHVLDIRMWDIKHWSLRDYEKQIWGKLDKDDQPKYMVDIVGMMKI